MTRIVDLITTRIGRKGSFACIISLTAGIVQLVINIIYSHNL